VGFSHFPPSTAGFGFTPGTSPLYAGGVDVKLGLRSNLVANFTVNTDFADADVDTEQFNLTPYKLFFPEKRQFFLENPSVSNFPLGGNVDSLFFSRAASRNRAGSNRDARVSPHRSRSRRVCCLTRRHESLWCSRPSNRDGGMPLFNRVAQLPRQEHAAGNDLRLSRIRVLEYGVHWGLHAGNNVAIVGPGEGRTWVPFCHKRLRTEPRVAPDVSNFLRHIVQS
jgi:hypothetical protein